MRYRNNTNDAIYELECQRTGNYGNEVNEENICKNGCCSSVLYRVDKRIICEDCLIEEVRNTFMELLSDDDDNYSLKIIKDMISDFSDSEILTYIENRYEKI